MCDTNFFDSVTGSYNFAETDSTTYLEDTYTFTITASAGLPEHIQ